MIYRLSVRYTRHLIGILLALFFLACSSTSDSRINSQKKERNQKKIEKGSSQLKDCDLILRTGRSFLSATVRRFSLNDQTYSHCGIVRIIHGKKWIYHAIGGTTTPSSAIRRESIQSFCNPKNNTGFGIFRYQLNKQQKKKIDSLTDAYYKKNIPFDMTFDLYTDSAFYCSEFLYKSITQATNKKYIPTSHLGNFKYVAIDNLYMNAHTSSVFQTVFQ